MRIISLDPGETTGVCDALVARDSMDFGIQVVMSDTIAWVDRFTVGELLSSNEQVPLPDVVVVESFRLYAHASRDQIGNSFPSVRVTGIIETFCFQLGILDRIVYQPASVMSRTKIPSNIRPSLQKSEHARDAFKHLRYYVVTKVWPR